MVNWIIVHYLYFKKGKRRDFYFTFMIISVAIYFLVCLMMGMERGKATMGVGLGLFGIFSLMRYRTDSMPVREMTYLFVVVCLSVVHAMADSLGVDAVGQITGTPLMELVVIDIIVMAAIMVFEATLKVDASTLKDIESNISILEEQLQNATQAEAAAINKSIQAWKKKADAIRKEGVEEKKAVKTGDKVNQGLQDMSSLMQNLSGLTSEGDSYWIMY